MSENSLSPFTVGRKNWLFCDTPKGAESSATAYSLIETAKANNLNVYKYLKYLLDHRPSSDMTDEQLSKFAPWNQDVIDNCSNEK